MSAGIARGLHAASGRRAEAKNCLASIAAERAGKQENRKTGNGRRRTEEGTTTDGRHGGDGERLLRRPPAAGHEPWEDGR